MYPPEVRSKRRRAFAARAGLAAGGIMAGARLHQADPLHELHVRVAGETDAGEDGSAARDLPRVEPHSLGEAEPQRQPALAFLVAVVVVDALDPHPAKAGIFRLGEDDRVLD